MQKNEMNMYNAKGYKTQDGRVRIGCRQREWKTAQAKGSNNAILRFSKSIKAMILCVFGRQLQAASASAAPIVHHDVRRELYFEDLDHAGPR